MRERGGGTCFTKGIMAGCGFVPCAPCVAPIFSVSQVFVNFKAATGAAPFMAAAVNDDTFHTCI